MSTSKGAWVVRHSAVTCIYAENCDTPDLPVMTRWGHFFATEIEALAFIRAMLCENEERHARMAAKRVARLAALDERIANVLAPPPPTSWSYARDAIETLALTARAFNCLWRAGIVSISDLEQHTPSDLLALRGFGVASLDNVRRALDAVGKALKS